MALTKKLSDFSNALKRLEEAHAKALEDRGSILLLSPDPLDLWIFGFKMLLKHLKNLRHSGLDPESMTPKARQCVDSESSSE